MAANGYTATARQPSPLVCCYGFYSFGIRFCCLKSLDGVIACTHRQNRMTCICFVVRKIGQFEWKYRRTFIRYECLRKWKCRCADIFMDILMGCEERFRSRNWMLIYQLNILFLLIFHFFISKQKYGIVIIHDGIDNK